MRPLMNEAISFAASLIPSASLLMESFCMSSSRTLTLSAFSEATMMMVCGCEEGEIVVEIVQVVDQDFGAVFSKFAIASL